MADVLVEASKEKAVNAMMTTNLETQIPKTDLTGALPLQNGWAAYGGSFGSPIYRLKDGICSVEGLIKGSHWGHLASLPVAP